MKVNSVMKTIKEAADEYAEKHGFRVPYNGSNEFYDKTDVRASEEGFLAGVEFAQRWISVDEELPPCSDEDILIKGIDYRGCEGIVDVGYMHEKEPGVENFISLSGEVIKVTHWRPIKLK